MDTEIIPTQDLTEELPAPEDTRNQRGLVVGLVIGGIALLAVIVGAVFLLLRPSTDTARVRDVFIIFMALESIVIGLALVILLVQLARLINLLQNEIKPIMDSTNETVSTLRGTTQFLSDNLVEPVMKLNEYLAGFGHLIRFVRPKK
ncbi:MAG: hypothetical protein H8E28_03485 [Anaerolineae bacterium]|nr:hypothetical protein [Anaerolineae bacterium]MBL6965424.1 hypothetical protein [Anaerolineales bacterium]